MNNIVNNLKLLYLKNTYIKYCEIFKKLENHIKNLEESFLFNKNEINYLKNNIYLFVKNINTEYNKEISTNFINIVNINNLYINNNNLLEHYYKNYPSSELLNNIKFKLIDLSKYYGFSNILDFLNLYFNTNIDSILNLELYDFLLEINDIVIPISINIFKLNNEKRLYFWKNIKEENTRDYLEKIRELWFKLSNNKYCKIKLIFKIDIFSSCFKTCQINRKIFYEKKKLILNNLKICPKFCKSFLRHDYIGNIYTMKHTEYINFVTEKYNIYLKLVNNTFINLMKKFIDKNMKITNTFYMIQLLLLLGDNDNIDIAGLLLGLIKEKNILPKVNLYDLIYNNFTYYLQNKIKKSSSHIKSEIKKIKSININNIDYKKQLAINKNIPENIKPFILEKIEEMKSFNNEYYKQQTYVKIILNYPWISKSDNLFFKNLLKDKNQSKKYLENLEDKLHNLCYGHKESKKSILEIIGKWISNPNSDGMSFGFVGPPGVGKTLLAKSLSSALDIPFAQITLGGQNDGELLHGHGYTYSGSQPGLIVKKMVEMSKSRCILYFDELDKACSKHGSMNEITSILIHLTDPNMNKSFQDRFFQGIDFPLNKVIFIFSYNDSKLIDPILLDRIKQIKINPYTLSDKLEICQNYIIPEIKESISINEDINFNSKILEYLINNYTIEAGVRNIKRKIEEIFLNLNLDKLFKRNLFKKNIKKLNITKNIIHNILKEPQISIDYIHNIPQIGIINGLFATTNGQGGIIQIQIYSQLQSTNNKYYTKLTGNQGDVMKESVQCSLTAAINYIENNKEKYNIDNLEKYLEDNFKNGFHIHTPSTSTPKDGPSAGCAFTSAFISRILKRKINNTVGMTGEIELNGNITKIGGLEFKLYGAKKANVKTVYIPEENKQDLIDIKKKYKKLIDNNFKVFTFKNISEIIDKILL